MCHKIEKGLVEMKVGDTTHFLCYDCMTKFAIDVMDFARFNLGEELGKRGV
jgi:hypothetical protein